MILVRSLAMAWGGSVALELLRERIHSTFP
jgi:hypothetical protein